jgi:hypothetical protein
MTVDVIEAGLRHYALLSREDAPSAPCCETGHPDPESAALHAWKLTRAIARREAKAA